jgi:Ca2+-binding EF-hand superfamily protein
MAKSEFETRIDNFEQRLREKMEQASGYGDPEVKARKLEQSFKQFDSNGSGCIDYNEFFAVMTAFNFVGCQREIEALFNRYDEDASGEIDYKEFAYHLFGIGSKPSMDVNSKNVVEKVKARIITKDGASGIHNVKRLLARMDRDGSGNLDRDELMYGLREYGINGLNGSDMDKIFNAFDRDRSGRISIEEFLTGLKSGMSFPRKMLVRQAFNLLDKSGDGEVRVNDIIQAYDFSQHPNVATGKSTPEEVAEEMLHTFEQGGDIDGKVTWAEFLDYYKGISAAIDDDRYFELMMRNAWHISGGEGAAANTSNRRVLVIHSDGTEEVVELTNDLGLNIRKREDVLAKLRLQGVRDIANFKL